jgi:hypothetical protein
MRAATIVYVYFLLKIVDHLSTWIAIQNEMGLEMNPYVETDSLWSIFFSPVPLVVDGIFVICVLISEKYAESIYRLLIRWSFLAPALLLPLYLIWMMTVFALSNTIGVLGFGFPLGWLAQQFRFLTEDMHTMLHYAMLVLNLAVLPLLFRIGVLIYAPCHPVEHCQGAVYPNKEQNQ